MSPIVINHQKSQPTPSAFVTSAAEHARCAAFADPLSSSPLLLAALRFVGPPRAQSAVPGGRVLSVFQFVGKRLRAIAKGSVRSE